MRTLKYHASLIEDLLAKGYDFIMASRFQSDPLERRFGQYRQMIGGRFLLGITEATSEKIIKHKTLLKDDVDISNILNGNVEHDDSRLYFIMFIFLAAQTKWLHFLRIAEK